MRNYLKFCVTLIGVLCLPPKSFAQAPSGDGYFYPERPHEVVGNEFFAVSTDCTDGTQAFAVKQGYDNTMSIYLLRDGKLLYSEYTDLGYIEDLICLKHAIIYTGDREVVRVLHYKDGAIVDENGRGEGQVPGKIFSDENRTVIIGYGDERYGQGKDVVNKIVLDQPMLIPDKKDAEIIPVDTMFQDPWNKSMKYPVKVTTMSSAIGRYFGYLDENGQPRLGNGAETPEFDSIPIPFVATNSFSYGSKDYIFGKKNGRLCAGIVFANPKKGGIAFKSVPLSQVPLKPYIK